LGGAVCGKIWAQGQIAIVDATVRVAAQSGFKTRPVKRGAKGKIPAVWCQKGLLAWIKIISPVK
jgi:hypothetical protein